jgi:hypothetical protein
MYCLSALKNYYRLQQPEKYMITRFMEKFHQDHDVRKILACWWVEDKIFFAKNDGLYTMTNLRNPYIYVTTLMCRLYGNQIIPTLRMLGSQLPIMSKWLCIQLGCNFITCNENNHREG